MSSYQSARKPIGHLYIFNAESALGINDTPRPVEFLAFEPPGMKRLFVFAATEVLYDTVPPFGDLDTVLQPHTFIARDTSIRHLANETLPPGPGNTREAVTEKCRALEMDYLKRKYVP